MKPLRLVKVLPFFTPRFGGSVTQARLLCRELAVRGHEVRVLTTDLGCPPAAPRNQWCEQDGYRVFFARTNAWHRCVPYAPPLALRREVSRALADADLLCCNVGLTLLNVSAADAARRQRVPFVYNAEGALAAERLQLKRLRKAVFVRLCERPLLHRAAALQAVTSAEALDLERQGAEPSKVHVIPNGVLEAVVDSAPLRREFRAESGIAEAALVLLFVGRLHWIKGVDLALAAAAPVLRERPGSRFLIVGPDDGAAASLRRQVVQLGLSEHVQFCGELHGERKQAAFAAADVFAHTSRSEGLPLAVLEAAAQALPLWLTDACHVPEVQEFDAGTIDPPAPGALQASLSDLFDAVDHRQRRAQNARRMVHERFALASVTDRLEELYQGLRR